jgi:hypothetical protein
MKFYYLIRNDGSVVEIPERDLDSTMKRNKGWKIKPEDTPVAKNVEGFACPVCPFISVSGFGLQAHRRSKHK